MGAQHAGKSTLCRYLANSSSQNVVLLDLDPGQPLAGPPGFVSLRVLDAPFLAETSAENTFERRIFLGATTPSDAPDAYVAAAARNGVGDAARGVGQGAVRVARARFNLELLRKVRGQP